MELGILLVGLFAGVMSGMFGIGGGIVMVPVLIAFFGMDMLNANATSLAAMLLPVAIFGVINYYKAGLVNVKDSLWLAGGLLLGSFFGAKLALYIDVIILSKLYALYLLYIAIGYMNIPALLAKKKNKNLDTTITKQKKAYSLWLFLALGMFAGIIAGMFGKGGGLIIVPILISFFDYQPKAATATSLAALQLPVGLPSVLVYAQQGYLNFLWAGLMALGILIGAFFGSKLALKLPSEIFKKVYAVFLLGVAVYMVAKYV